MASDPVSSRKISELEEKLILRKQLQDITNRIHAAQNLKQILVDLKDGILTLFRRPFRHDLRGGQDPQRDLTHVSERDGAQGHRVPISNNSIAVLWPTRAKS
jgi:hypothetical protein